MVIAALLLENLETALRLFAVIRDGLGIVTGCPSWDVFSDFCPIDRHFTKRERGDAVLAVEDSLAVQLLSTK